MKEPQLGTVSRPQPRYIVAAVVGDAYAGAVAGDAHWKIADGETHASRVKAICKERRFGTNGFVGPPIVARA